MDVCVCVCLCVCGHWSIQSCTVQQNGEDCIFLTLEVCVYIHTCIHSYMHACIHTYIQMHAHLHNIYRACISLQLLAACYHVYLCVCVCVCVQVIGKGKIPCDSVICNQANPDGMQLILFTHLGDIVVNGFGEVEFHDG